MPELSDIQKGAHLLRRFGLGSSDAEAAHLMRNGLDGAVEELLNPPPDPGAEVPPRFMVDNLAAFRERDAVNGWVLRMLKTRRPLEERMTIFWHNHFATSLDKVPAVMLYAQIDTLRANALGSFPRLLEAVSKDPAMLVWLDNVDNVRGKPNENFAREVMELFTLGIGHYTETDVQEAARAFTGWGFEPGVGVHAGEAEFLFRASRHDNGLKTVLGRTGPLGGEDVLQTLCAQPRTAEFLTAKLWDWFVWPHPDQATVAPFADRFRAVGYDVKALLRDIMHSPEFYSPRAYRAIVKSPVDLVITTMRQLGLGEAARKAGPEGLRPAFAAHLAMKEMGQWLMNPGDVSGWKNGRSWITSATMIARVAWGGLLFGEGKSGYKNVPYTPLALAGVTRPEDAVRRLTTLFDAPVPPARHRVYVEAATKASGGTVTPANAPRVAAAVARLIFGSPEFQFC